VRSRQAGLPPHADKIKFDGFAGDPRWRDCLRRRALSGSAKLGEECVSGARPLEPGRAGRAFRRLGGRRIELERCHRTPPGHDGNERALGISSIYAAQTWRQLAAVFGEQEARALFGLTNVLVMFGGSKDGAFNQEISDLIGQVPVTRCTWQTRVRAVRTFSGGGIGILRGAYGRGPICRRPRRGATSRDCG
jgi:TraM recognition site of TraD and TraG